MEYVRKLVYVRTRIIEQFFFKQLRCISLTPNKQAENTRVRAPNRLFNG